MRFGPFYVRAAFFFCVSLLLGGLATAAPLLVQTPGPFASAADTPTNISYGVLAKVDVGAANVDVSGIGVYGSVDEALNMKWAIFTGASGSAPVFQTAASSLGITSAQWFDSPSFSPFTLLANQTYWIGSIIDGPLGAFNSAYNFPGTLVSSNGLTLPAGINGNVELNR